jgi:hypothetical protein
MNTTTIWNLKNLTSISREAAQPAAAADPAALRASGRQSRMTLGRQAIPLVGIARPPCWRAQIQLASQRRARVVFRK